MNLKYSSIFLFLATSLFGSNALAANTIQFTGKIVDSSCKVEVKDGTNNTVELGVWPTSSFGSQGDKTTPIPFTLTISDCAEGSNGVKGYYMDFNVATDDNDSSLIKLNQENGVAKNVGIGISKVGDTGSLITLNQAYQNKFTVDEKNKVGEMPLQAFYQQDSGNPVESGLANATAVVVVSMK